MSEAPREEPQPTLKEVFGQLHAVSPIQYIAMATWWERLIDNTKDETAKKTLIVIFNDALPKGVAKWRRK